MPLNAGELSLFPLKTAKRVSKPELLKMKTTAAPSNWTLTKYFVPLAVQAVSQALTYPLAAMVASRGPGGPLKIAGLAQAINVMFFLGMIMVPVGIYALTLPIVFPMLITLGYDPIWFGVIALKLTEIGAITPPVGLNVYAMKGVIPREENISLEDIFRGIWPFCLCDIVVLIVLIFIPQLSTWLPEVLLG